MFRPVRHAILVLSLMTVPAMAFTARNAVEVQGSAERIEVQPTAGQAAPESWCAAGDFVIRGLGLPGTTLVYRLTPPPRRSGERVTFSLSPEGATDRTGLLQIGTYGNAVTAAHAQALCRTGGKRF